MEARRAHRGEPPFFTTNLGEVMATTKIAKLEPVDLKLEVVVLGVSDVDRAKAFYENLGWRLDADFSNGDDFRIMQVTPHLARRLRSSSARESRRPSLDR